MRKVACKTPAFSSLTMCVLENPLVTISECFIFDSSLEDTYFPFFHHQLKEIKIKKMSLFVYFHHQLKDIIFDIIFVLLA